MTNRALLLSSVALLAGCASTPWPAVKPSRLRCFTCTDYDLRASSGTGGFDTSYWHGRWTRY